MEKENAEWKERRESEQEGGARGWSKRVEQEGGERERERERGRLVNWKEE